MIKKKTIFVIMLIKKDNYYKKSLFHEKNFLNVKMFKKEYKYKT